MRWWWAAALLIMAFVPPWGAVVLLVLLAVAAVARDVHRYPRLPCRACKGEGAFFSRLRPGAIGRCTSCEGRKTRPSPLLKITEPGTYDDIKNGRKGKYH